MKRLLQALLACWALAAPAPARALTVAEIFTRLPSVECGGYNAAQRQDLLSHMTEIPGASGLAAPPPPPLSPWLRNPAENFLILQRPQAGPITYKLFEGRSFQLLVICRGRERPFPGDPVDPMDLSLYRLDQVGLTKVDPHDYLPPIGILDFVTADTVTDARAVGTLARLAPAYAECLSCSLSASHRLTLDIVTATAFNAAPCDDLLPTFGRLPLTWNGQVFAKPYDRAAPREYEGPAERRAKNQDVPRRP